MNFGLIAVGGIKEKYLKNKINEYKTAINRAVKLDVIEVKDEPIPKGGGDSAARLVRKKEGERILAKIMPSDYVIALCVDGVKLNEKELSTVLKKASDREYGRILFVIGGSLGLSEDVICRANYRLSFSDMTFPHQLMRVMLLDGIGKTVAICDR